MGSTSVAADTKRLEVCRDPCLSPTAVTPNLLYDFDSETEPACVIRCANWCNENDTSATESTDSVMSVVQAAPIPPQRGIVNRLSTKLRTRLTTANTSVPLSRCNDELMGSARYPTNTAGTARNSTRVIATVSGYSGPNSSGTIHEAKAITKTATAEPIIATV